MTWRKVIEEAQAFGFSRSKWINNRQQKSRDMSCREIAAEGPSRSIPEGCVRGMERHLSPQDAVVIEMTTNTWDVYDALLPHVHSVCVVHPPHVKAVTNPQVMTDKIAARTIRRPGTIEYLTRSLARRQGGCGFCC